MLHSNFSSHADCEKEGLLMSGLYQEREGGREEEGAMEGEERKEFVSKSSCFDT